MALPAVWRFMLLACLVTVAVLVTQLASFGQKGGQDSSLVSRSSSLEVQQLIRPADNQPEHTAAAVLGNAEDWGDYNETLRLHGKLAPGYQPITPANDPAQHCQVTRGSWCGPYWTQPRVPARPPPRSNKPCPGKCNGRGVCHHGTGTCDCPAGWTGDACKVPLKRPCRNMGPDGRDADWSMPGHSHTRCAGICDDDIAFCFCPPETKYGRQPAPPGSPPGTPPLVEGRPMWNIHPKQNKPDGPEAAWAGPGYTYDMFMGPHGWCNVNWKNNTYECWLDGRFGLYCDVMAEQFCVNQCSGHGRCDQGFCHCHPGWYGHDCALKVAGQTMEQGDEVTKKPYLQPVVGRVPAAEDPPTRQYRKRPFIYVYDMAPEFHSRMLQYRGDRYICVDRLFSDTNNGTRWIGYNAYGLETVFHHLMLTSEHRTFDPEEADYFYLPVYAACLPGIVGHAHLPVWNEEGNDAKQQTRPQNMALMLLAAKQWVAQKYPYWNRTQGRDHIWLLTHDEGPCYIHKDLWPSVIVSHWGRTQFPHSSWSSYGPDNYSFDAGPLKHSLMPDGYLAATAHAHPCHDPRNHVVVPVWKQPDHYKDSPYLGAPLVTRDILVFFRGDLGITRPGCVYSRCTRQTLYKLYTEHNWHQKYNVLLGKEADGAGEYSKLLARSKFCLVLPGDGWSARYEDAMTHGCVPVIVMDETLGPWETQIDYSQFAIRLRENELDKLIDVVTAITPERLAEMQAAGAKVWSRFRWNGLPFGESNVLQIMAGHARRYPDGQLPGNRSGMQWAQTGDDDAFSSLMQVLYARLTPKQLVRQRRSTPAAR